MKKYESIIHNNSSSSEKVFWSESGEKSASDQAAFTRQNSSKQICGWILMWETTADALFHWRKSYYGLWTHISSWICFSFCLLQMLTDGLEWCGLFVDYCDVFISCLDSHSDGTHSLQSIHCWDTDAETHFYKSDEETNSSWSWMNWGWVDFQQTFIFGWTIPLNCNVIEQVKLYKPRKPKIRTRWWWSRSCRPETWARRRRSRRCTPGGSGYRRTAEWEYRYPESWNNTNPADWIIYRNNMMM